LCFVVIWLSVPLQSITRKNRVQNDLLCVEWDLKHYTLTHSRTVYKSAGKVPEWSREWQLVK